MYVFKPSIFFWFVRFLNMGLWLEMLLTFTALSMKWSAIPKLGEMNRLKVQVSLSKLHNICVKQNTVRFVNILPEGQKNDLTTRYQNQKQNSLHCSLSVYLVLIIQYTCMYWIYRVNACVAYGGWVPRNLGAGAADSQPR